jgi:hypothetical protein
MEIHSWVTGHIVKAKRSIEQIERRKHDLTGFLPSNGRQDCRPTTYMESCVRSFAGGELSISRTALMCSLHSGSTTSTSRP